MSDQEQEGQHLSPLSQDDDRGATGHGMIVIF
jgi:hypothetical protein